MEARPPALIDALVRLSIPQPCREHVVGDLWERYRSPSRFLVDAVRTVPFVVASQIRRTTTLSAVFIQTFVMVVAFATGSRGFWPAVVPVTVVLLTLVLRDAYKPALSISARQTAVDLGWAAGALAVSQGVLAVVRPDLLMPLTGGIVGSLAVFTMLFFLRLQNPGLGSYPRQVPAPAPASLEALVTEVRVYERLTMRGSRIEIGAGLLLGAFFIGPMLSAQNWVIGVGWALSSAYALYVAAFVAFHRPRRMPDGLSLHEAAAFYREELRRRHRLTETMWLWYVLPFAPGVLFVTVGGAMLAAGRGKPVWPAVILPLVAGVIGLIVHRGSSDTARRVRERIDVLSTVGES
jgi:hypothetical protein